MWRYEHKEELEYGKYTTEYPIRQPVKYQVRSPVQSVEYRKNYILPANKMQNGIYIDYKLNHSPYLPTSTPVGMVILNYLTMGADPTLNIITGLADGSVESLYGAPSLYDEISIYGHDELFLEQNSFTEDDDKFLAWDELKKYIIRLPNATQYAGLYDQIVMLELDLFAKYGKYPVILYFDEALAELYPAPIVYEEEVEPEPLPRVGIGKSAVGKRFRQPTAGITTVQQTRPAETVTTTTSSPGTRTVRTAPTSARTERTVRTAPTQQTTTRKTVTTAPARQVRFSTPMEETDVSVTERSYSPSSRSYSPSPAPIRGRRY